jgi:hypothetical protein
LFSVEMADSASTTSSFAASESADAADARDCKRRSCSAVLVYSISENSHVLAAMRTATAVVSHDGDPRGGL